MIHRDSELTIDDISRTLGRTPQFLFAAAEAASSQYSVFDLPKRSGGARTICSPKNDLKRLQREILEEILWTFTMPDYVHGCVRGRSIVSNAQPHVNKPLVLTIDIKDFFGSIKPALVKQIFLEHFQCDEQCAELLTKLTTYGNFLPQGAPTSPTIANIAALPVDHAIIEICQQSSIQFSYTRYVDDITISGDTKLAFLLGPFYRAIADCGFVASPDKLKTGRPSNRQKVTGVIVNKKMSPPKKLIRKLRQQLYYCEKFGILDHCKREDIESEDFLNQINGMLGYIRLTLPEVADEFKIKLTSIGGYNPVREDESKFLLLRFAVAEEVHVIFKYDDAERKAAPVEIYIDDDGRKIVRAYQVSPEPGWKHFYIPSMQELKLYENI